MDMRDKINFVPKTIDPNTLDNCAICGNPFEGTGFICAKCWASVKWNMEPEDVKVYENEDISIWK